MSIVHSYQIQYGQYGDNVQAYFMSTNDTFHTAQTPVFAELKPPTPTSQS